jgi:hypothetical protein
LLNNFILYLIYKADDHALRASAGSSPRSVEVSLVILWRIEMENTLNVIHMNTSCRHISGNQGLNLTISKCSQCTLTLMLTSITMNRCRRNSHLLQLASCTVSTMLGSGENNCSAVFFHNMHSYWDSIWTIHRPKFMFHRMNVGLIRTYLMSYRIFLIVLCKHCDVAIKRG